jgi:hypothetical protein
MPTVRDLAGDVGVQAACRALEVPAASYYPNFRSSRGCISIFQALRPKSRHYISAIAALILSRSGSLSPSRSSSAA